MSANWTAEDATGDGPPIVEVVEALRACYGTPDRGDPEPPIDGLIATILSQNTSDINTERSFRSLKQRFPDWDAVIDAPVSEVADAIRSGGLADRKAPRIQAVLRAIRDRTGGYDLSFLGAMEIEEARDWLMALNGVGPKTASCVLMFNLGRDAMPVDTHVHRVAARLHLLPPGTSAERAHAILEAQLPPGMAHDAHLLMIRHGRETCTARRPRCADCVLVHCCPSAPLFLGAFDTSTNGAEISS
ncbi:MAG TPA: hypothetical protein DEU95_07345 [Chloroflexi bacterium]|nr:hypothetical protein [Chloroflexota bacterium]HCG29547.1 hypothetical protein [Chloroflexota bacterium]